MSFDDRGEGRPNNGQIEQRSEPDRTPSGAASLRSHARAFARKMMLLMASLAVSWLLAEGALRLAGAHFESSLYTPDPVLGWTFRPGATGWVVHEGRNQVVINSDGNRDKERTLAKPPDVVRIALVGDSFAAGVALPLEQTVGAQLERGLNDCGAFGRKRAEVLSFAVPGYGPQQELLMIQNRVWKYDPDIVLVAFFGLNDLANLHPALNVYAVHPTPYFVFEGDNLVLDESYRRQMPGPTALWARNVFADAMNRSELALLIKQTVGAVGKPHPHASRPRDLGDPDRQALMPPRTPEMIEAWRRFEALLPKMVAEVRGHGAELVMMAVSSAQQVHPDLNERAELMKVLGVDNLFYTEERVARLAEKEHFTFLSLPQEMADYTAKNKVFLHGFPNAVPWGGHWNAAGHAFAGHRVASHFCRRRENATLTPSVF